MSYFHDAIDKQKEQNKIILDYLDAIPDKQEAQEWKDLSKGIDFNIPFDGIARDLQQWIISGQLRSQVGLSLLSTLAILATVKGRCLSYEGMIKGNMTLIGLCESGDGKDYCYKVVDKALKQASDKKNDLSNLVHGKQSSGASLVEAISNHGNTALLLIDEVGHFFSGVTGSKAGVYANEIVPMITELYTSSHDSYMPKSKKGQRGERIEQPNLTLLGMSSEKQFLDTLNDNMLEDGSLARFLIIFGEKNPPPLFNASREQIPEHIKESLLSYYRLNTAYRNGDYEPELLKVTDDYKKEFEYLLIYFYNKAIECVGDKNKGKFVPFFKRLAVRSLQMALLIDDCQSIDVLKWCAEINEKSLDIFIKKYNHNTNGSSYENWIKTVEKSIKESGKKGISKNDLRIKCRSMAVDTRDKIIADLINHEQIFKKEVKQGDKMVVKYFWSA